MCNVPLVPQRIRAFLTVANCIGITLRVLTQFHVCCWVCVCVCVLPLSFFYFSYFSYASWYPCDRSLLYTHTAHSYRGTWGRSACGKHIDKKKLKCIIFAQWFRVLRAPSTAYTSFELVFMEKLLVVLQPHWYKVNIVPLHNYNEHTTHTHGCWFPSIIEPNVI